MLKILTGVFSWLASHLALANNIPITYHTTWVDDQGVERILEYTPYYLLEYRDQETHLYCRTFITLGDERLPADEKKYYKQQAKQLFKNGERVFAVAETYFYNQSNEKILIQPISFTWKGVADDAPFEIANYHLAVEPKSQALTPSIIKYAFYLTTEFGIEFSLNINGKPHQIKGRAKRLTQEELAELKAP